MSGHNNLQVTMARTTSSDTHNTLVDVIQTNLSSKSCSYTPPVWRVAYYMTNGPGYLSNNRQTSERRVLKDLERSLRT